MIVGAGPAGLAPLFAAASAGRLSELLEGGVTILERSSEVGAGSLGNHAIDSDSTADSLLDIVRRSQDPHLAALQHHPSTRALAAFAKGPAPLTTVAAFLKVAGTALCDIVASSRRGRVLTGATALAVRQTAEGAWCLRFEKQGCVQEVEAQHVILASGAYQPADRPWSETVAGVPLARYASKLLRSGEVLAHGGAAALQARLHHRAKPKLVILGGSTSAVSVAQIALTQLPEIPLSAGSVTLLHRSPLRIFYETVDDAHADGYTEFSQHDICPLTGRVFRFAGFRLQSRELVLRARGLAGRVRDPRLHLLPLTPENDAEAQDLLREADILVAALGYRPRLLPVLNQQGQHIRLFEPKNKRWSVVDEWSRVLTQRGQPLPGLYAIGLAVGPGAHARIGGEAGFTGQVNSLWMWQNLIGETIVHQVLHTTLGGASESAPMSLPAQRVVLAERNAAFEIPGSPQLAGVA